MTRRKRSYSELKLATSPACHDRFAPLSAFAEPSTHYLIHSAREALAAMNPVLDSEDYVFCATADFTTIVKASSDALCIFREQEGTSLILPRAAAERFGFSVSLPMRRITLMANSALDGVGFTAAVPAALAAERIPCNVVAGYRHDHLFVPKDMAERALAVLKRMQSDAAASDATSD